MNTQAFDVPTHVKRDTNRTATAVATEFNGRSARHAKRRALQFWYSHRDQLGLSMAEFFGRCRLQSRGPGSRIIFSPDRP